MVKILTLVMIAYDGFFYNISEDEETYHNLSYLYDYRG